MDERRAERVVPQHAKCPRCQSSDTIPIVYGMPGPDLFEAEERGEVLLAGCIVSHVDPTWACTACDNRFGVYRWDDEHPDWPEILAERRARFDLLTVSEQERCLRFSEWDAETQDAVLRWARWGLAEWAAAVAEEIRDGLYDEQLEELSWAIAERRSTN
jgi:hypothetical protein